MIVYREIIESVHVLADAACQLQVYVETCCACFIY